MKFKKGLLGGIDLNTKSLVIVIVAAVAAYYITKKALNKNKATTAQAASKVPTNPAKRYMKDIDHNDVTGRIIQAIAVNATEKEKVFLAMDQIVLTLNSKKPYIDSLIEERKTGAITREEFNDRLKELIKMIGQELGIQLRTKNIDSKGNMIPHGFTRDHFKPSE
jgi:hypothetical protein